MPLAEMDNSCVAQSILTFRCGDKLCGLPLRSVRRILFVPELHRPPLAPRFLAGMLDLEGELHPVVLLTELFNLPATPAGLYGQIILLSSPPFGILADGVDGVCHDPTATPLNASDVFHGCVTARVTFGEREYHLLDPERLLLEAESRKLDEFRRMENRRLAELEAGT